jgi:hypothetical protein
MPIKPEEYYAAKLHLKESVLQIVNRGFFNQEDIEEDIIHFLHYNEPQIAYTNLVAMFVKAEKPISKETYEDIQNLGMSLDISNGVTWNEDETQTWWAKLAVLIE